MSRLRWALVALLVASTALFTVGVVAERSHPEPTSTHVEAAHEEGEAGERPEQVEPDETLFGIDLESTPLIVLAVIVGLALAALVATQFGMRPGVLAAIAVVALAWAVLDVREIAHQLDESNTGIALVALAAAVLHATAAALALLLANRAVTSARAGLLDSSA
jgi:hypothetical protein